MTLIDLFIHDYARYNLLQQERYKDKRRLQRYEYQIYSQHGEDGIINEIFKRIGTKNKTFVEFGCQDGMTNNTTALLLEDWSGTWFDESKEHIKTVNRTFSNEINRGKLTVRQAMLTRENIEQVFEDAGVLPKIDLLSIDVDGNDYWLWDALRNYKARCVIIECNPLFRCLDWCIPYNPQFKCNLDSTYGASLKALEHLGNKKDMILVGCDLSGCNAFFVEKQYAHMFCEPFTAENHYEGDRRYLNQQIGDKRSWCSNWKRGK